MDRKARPPNLQLQERCQRFDIQPKLMKTGAIFRAQKGKHSKDYKEWKAVSHSVSILFNGKLPSFEKYLIGMDWHEQSHFYVAVCVGVCGSQRKNI